MQENLSGHPSHGKIRGAFAWPDKIGDRGSSRTYQKCSPASQFSRNGVAEPLLLNDVFGVLHEKKHRSLPWFLGLSGMRKLCPVLGKVTSREASATDRWIIFEMQRKDVMLITKIRYMALQPGEDTVHP